MCGFNKRHLSSFLHKLYHLNDDITQSYEKYCPLNIKVLTADWRSQSNTVHREMFGHALEWRWTGSMTRPWAQTLLLHPGVVIVHLVTVALLWGPPGVGEAGPGLQPASCMSVLRGSLVHGRVQLQFLQVHRVTVVGQLLGDADTSIVGRQADHEVNL